MKFVPSCRWNWIYIENILFLLNIASTIREYYYKRDYLGSHLRLIFQEFFQKSIQNGLKWFLKLKKLI